MLVLPFFVETFGLSQAAVDEVNILLGCSDALLRFFLEGVQNVDRLLKADRIDGAPRVAGMVCDNFKHRSSTKTFQWLCRGVGFTLLGGIERLAGIAPDLAREGRAGLFGLSRSRSAVFPVLPLYEYTSIYITLSREWFFCFPELCMRGFRF
jgi:hypothetical protein